MMRPLHPSVASRLSADHVALYNKDLAGQPRLEEVGFDPASRLVAPPAKHPWARDPVEGVTSAELLVEWPQGAGMGLHAEGLDFDEPGACRVGLCWPKEQGDAARG
jgi:hypothetical protein